MALPQKKQSSPEKILDAAETLFSKRGFYGASLRDIAKEAGVQMSLLNYHFGPKDALFREVVRRRAEEHARAIEESLESLHAGKDAGSIVAEDVIRALVTPIFNRYLNGGEGWRNYIQLLSRTADEHYDADSTAPFVEAYQPIMDRYTDAFLKLFPHADRHDVFWSIIFLESALSSMLLETDLPERVSKGEFRSGDMQPAIERMVAFFAAGFARLAEGG